MNIKSSPLLLSLVFSVIFLFGIFLRFYQLGSIPPGPEWDEASVGYNAYSIAQTGKDEHGNKLPLIFPAFGDYKNPLYIYLTAPIVKLFGLNMVTARFINALSGSLMVAIWFFIPQLIFSNLTLSLLTSFFVAVSPLSLFFSRIAGDGMMLSAFLISLGLMLELWYIKSHKYYLFYGSIFALILSMFSYNLGRIVAPIFIIIIFISFILDKKSNKKILLLPIIFCLIGIFIIFQQSKLSISSRLQYVGIFGREKGTVLQINKYRDQDKNNLIAKILHNKLTFFLITTSSNYLSHFSSDFLVNKKINVPVSESVFPPLQIIMLPFYYFGILYGLQILFSKGIINKWMLILVFSLFFLAPLPSTITEGSPSSKRNLAQLGFFEFFTSLGLVWGINQIKNIKNSIISKITNILISIFIIISIGISIYVFFYIFPKEFGFMYARKEAKICEVINRNYQKYDYFIYSRKINGVPYIFPLFCFSVNPHTYVSSRKFRIIEGWYYIDSFDKYLFFDEINAENINAIKQLYGKKILLFLNENEFNNSIKQIYNDKLSPQTDPNIPIEPIIQDPKNILYQLTLLIQ